MTPASTHRGPLRRAVRSFAYRTFYGLPPWLRRRFVRLGVGTYTVGAVVLATRIPSTSAREEQPTGHSMIGQPGAPETGHLLMVRQPPGKGWSLPAGLLDRGERPIHGAARELAEETGVVLDPEALTPAVPSSVVHTSGRWIDMVFTTTIAPEVPLIADGDEILEAAWQPIESLPPVTPATGRLLAHYGIGPYADPEVTQ